jgi:hypothetical protein
MEPLSMSQPAFLIAALLTVAIGIAHSWIGERLLIGPLLAPDRRSGILAASAFARNTLRFAWHVTSIAWWGLGAVLALLATSPLGAQGRLIIAAIGATFLITGLITLVASRGRHLAWPVFLAIAGLSWAPLV